MAGVPNANQRAKRIAREVDETENTLATAIGRAVAVELGQLLQPLAAMLPQLATSLRPQKIACAYCTARHKLAQQAGDEQLPQIQEAFTWVPVQAAPGVPPSSLPVCYDDYPTEPTAPAEAKPGFRPTGLVAPDGRQIVAQD